MFQTMAKISAARTSLRGICWIDIQELYSSCLSLVFYKLPQLIKRPPVQTRTHFFTCFDSFTNFFQVFHNDLRTSTLLSFRHNLFGHRVIHMANIAFFFAGDFPQPLFCRLRTIARQTLPVSQKLIALFSKDSSSKQFSCGGGSQNIFSKIHTYCYSRFYWGNIGEIEDKMEKPTIAFAHQLRFFRKSFIQKSLVKFTHLQRNLDAPLQSVQRENSIFQKVRPFIKMDRTSFFKQELFWAFQGGQSCRSFCHCIATHLRTELWKLFPQPSIAKMVQSNSIPLFFTGCYLRHTITYRCKEVLQFFKSLFLKVTAIESDRNRSFHTKDFKILVSLQTTIEERQFLPTLKDYSFLAVKWMKMGN